MRNFDCSRLAVLSSCMQHDFLVHSLIEGGVEDGGAAGLAVFYKLICKGGEIHHNEVL